MIVQITSDAEGNPHYALTSAGNLMVWQRSEMPFGGIQYEFKHLADNKFVSFSPASGFLHKLIQAPQPTESSDSLLHIAEARVKLAFGNCLVQGAHPKIIMKVCDHQAEAKFVIDVTEYPSEENKHVGKFTASVFVLNTREDFKGWWRPEVGTIGFSK